MHKSWDEIYARQSERAALVREWMDALRIAQGECILEIGSGPGDVSLALSSRVGASGLVYAVDPSAEALRYLERLQSERGITNIERIVADASTLRLPRGDVDAALIALVLHRSNDPAGILLSASRLVRPEGSVLVAEFHPDGPCEHGPPRERRLNPSKVRDWCRAVGLHEHYERRQSPEYYMWLFHRRLSAGIRLRPRPLSRQD